MGFLSTSGAAFGFAVAPEVGMTKMTIIGGRAAYEAEVVGLNAATVDAIALELGRH